jgi:uncharacterized protein
LPVFLGRGNNMSDLKFSFYNIFFDIDNKHYIYNTLSTALAQIDDKTFSSVKKNDITSLDPEYIDEMLNQRFLTDSQINESLEYLYFYNHIRFGRSAKSLAINFIPSYSCNLACPYCMQGQSKTNARIKLEDIDKILLFVSNTIENSFTGNMPINKVFTHLYGGEPLLQKPALIYFCDGIMNIVKKHGCEINFSMTSNMTLLDDEIIDFFKKYQINVQISIDGTGEQHDKRRIYADGSGTYKTILDNLKKFSGNGLKDLVVIRLNIDKDNLKDAENIFTAVHEYSNDVYFGFLDSFKGYNDSFLSHCVSNEIYPEIVSKTFNDIYQKYGQAASVSFGKMSPCSLNSENKYFIDLFLNVYKCEMLLNQPENRVGYIDNGGQFIRTSGFYQQMNRTPGLFPECMKCRLLPLCAGGCAGKAFINDGNIDKSLCMFNEQSLIVYLKDYISRSV